MKTLLKIEGIWLRKATMRYLAGTQCRYLRYLQFVLPGIIDLKASSLNPGIAGRLARSQFLLEHDVSAPKYFSTYQKLFRK